VLLPLNLLWKADNVQYLLQNPAEATNGVAETPAEAGGATASAEAKSPETEKEVSWKLDSTRLKLHLI